jgi:polysaccharide export outer membrane protein
MLNTLRRLKVVSVLLLCPLVALPAGKKKPKQAVAPQTVAEALPSAGATAMASSSMPATRSALQTGSEFRIGPGDVIGIDVWKEPDASRPTIPVRPDGKITLPMVGEVSVAGMSPVELESSLSSKYSSYIRNAQVTVTVKEIHSQKAYLIGEVKKEGAIALQGPMTVLQALAEAGGVTDFAKRKKIYILRPQPKGQVILHFDYDAVVRGEKMAQNIVLLPGDTIVVPR